MIRSRKLLYKRKSFLTNRTRGYTTKRRLIISKKSENDLIASIPPTSPTSTPPPTSTIEVTEAATPSSKYSKRKECDVLAWIEARDDIISTYVTSEVPSTFKCGFCCVTCVDIIRCLDCGPLSYYCTNCYIKIHANRMIFHVSEKWMEGTFIRYQNDQCKMLSRNDDHSCTTSYLKELSLIDGKGRIHKVLLEFCGCETEYVTLLRFRMWPSNPRNLKVAFSFDLLNEIEMLQMEAHMSLYSFCQSLRWRNDLTETETNLIYRVLTNECFDEYRFFKKKIKTLEPFGLEKYAKPTCPACPKIFLSKNSGDEVSCQGDTAAGHQTLTSQKRGNTDREQLVDYGSTGNGS